MAATRNIGVEVQAPESSCADRNCPFHGTLRLRGQVLTGRVVSAKMAATAVVERERRHYLPKFERYERRTSRFSAHNPPCVAAEAGDEVRLMECRPLAKTVTFCIIERRKGKALVTGEDYTEEERAAGAARSSSVKVPPQEGPE